MDRTRPDRPLITKPFEGWNERRDRALDAVREWPIWPRQRVVVYDAGFLEERLPAYRSEGGGSEEAAWRAGLDMGTVVRTAYDAGLEVLDCVSSIRRAHRRKPDQIANGGDVTKHVVKGLPAVEVATLRGDPAELAYANIAKYAKELEKQVGRYAAAKRVVRAAQLRELREDVMAAGTPVEIAAVGMVERSLEYGGAACDEVQCAAKLPKLGPRDAVGRALFFADREADYLRQLAYHTGVVVVGTEVQSVSNRDLRSVRSALLLARDCDDEFRKAVGAWRREAYGELEGTQLGLVAEEPGWRGRFREGEEAYRLLARAEPGRWDAAMAVQRVAELDFETDDVELVYRAGIAGAATAVGTLTVTDWSREEALVAVAGTMAIGLVGKWLPRVAKFVRDYRKVYAVANELELREIEPEG